MAGAESRGKGRAATRSHHSPPVGPRGTFNRAHHTAFGGQQAMQRHEESYRTTRRAAP